ncbi:MAG: substrate-binding domain-containing protein, partial [Bacteroidota bacterium]|nr:substrate-binding domain-containing protein [Bacteroidota bacterium]
VSREVYPAEYKKGAHPISVVKDAVVPVVSASNPALKEILARGLKRDAAYNIWISGRYKSWSQAFGVKQNVPIHVYTRSDASGAAEVWAKYFGKKQEDLNGVGVYGDPGLTQAVKRDPAGIGFNNIGYAYDAKTRKPIPGIYVIPLDLNNNNKIDPNENFYGNLDQLTEAISSGRFPSPPARELYFVTKGKPQKKIVKDFIYWVLTEGQKYVDQAGYIAIPKSKISTEIKRVN